MSMIDRLSGKVAHKGHACSIEYELRSIQI